MAETGLIDNIEINQRSGVANLVIHDDAPWSADSTLHMGRIRGRLNEYLSFIESGALLEACDFLEGKRLVLKVVSKHPRSPEAAEFYEELGDALASNGYPFLLEVRD
jgi:hypothetical protein